MTRSLRIRLTEGSRSIDALYQLGCGRAGVQSEYNCRIFSADHTLHILRADIYVRIMFGMLMRSLGPPPLPLFRSPRRYYFARFFDTSKHATHLFSLLSAFPFDRRWSFRCYVTLRYMHKIDRSSRNRRPSCDTVLPLFLHTRAIVTSRFIALMIYTRLGYAI